MPFAGNAVSGTVEASRGGVEVDGLLDATAEHGFALLDDDAPVAELLRGAGRVGDEQHGHVLVGDDAVDPLAALLRELAVADGQRLVHHQDVRADRRHEREAQTGAHTARIRAHRLVDVLAEFRELHDFPQLPLLYRNR